MELLLYAKALADETRIRLAALLNEYELNVGEAVRILDMGQSRVSRHLKILADAGLVVSRRDGLWTFYSAAPRGRERLFLDGLTPFFDKDAIFETDRRAARRAVAERTLSTRRFFDAVAPQWDDLSREILGDFELGPKVKAHLKACGAAADLGCGAGSLLPVLAEKADTVIGVDHSTRMLEAARERFADNPGISLRIGELEHLPLRDGEVDCALMSMTLHHLSSPGDGLAEAARALAPGGTLLVADFDRHDKEDLRRRHGDRRLGFDAGELAELLAKAGFADVAELGRVPLPSGLTLVFTRAEKPQTRPKTI